MGRLRRVKVWDAYEACATKVDAFSAQRKLGKEVSDDTLREAYSNMGQVFTSAFNQRITEVIKLTGPAMAPTLNRKGLTDPSVSETLVVRKLRSPSKENVRIGDVSTLPALCFALPVRPCVLRFSMCVDLQAECSASSWNALTALCNCLLHDPSP